MKFEANKEFMENLLLTLVKVRLRNAILTYLIHYIFILFLDLCICTIPKSISNGKVDYDFGLR